MTKDKRITNGILCFILSFLFGSLGMGIMLISEAYRSEKSGETISKSTLYYVAYFTSVPIV